jgi:hypothetical protein
VSGPDVMVLDPGNARIDTYRADSRGMRLISSKRFTLGGRSICNLGEKLYANVLHQGSVVHEIGDTPAPIRSFGSAPAVSGLEALGAFRGMAEGMLASGLIVCYDQPPLIIVAATAQPFISAYRADGSVVWSVRLRDYNQIAYELSPAGALRTRINASAGAHIAQQIVPWSNNTVLVQYEMRKPGARPDDSEIVIETRIHDVRTGRELTRRRDLPYIAATAGPYVYFTTTDPFPQIRVMRRR